MTFKDFLKTKTAFVLMMLLAALVVFLIAFSLVFSWMGSYTRHGQEVQVPDLKGMYIEEAVIMAASEGLSVQVIDSTYSRTVPLGAIVDQNPPAGSSAKRDRSVYVIVNAKTIRQIPLPDLRDISYRQAEATLKTLGLEVADVVYEPSVYKNLVLDVRRGDVSIEPGTRVKEGEKLTLVIGFGQGTEMVRVPDLTGLNQEAVRSQLLAARLILGSVEYDEELTDDNRELFVVYNQSEVAGVEILEGSRIDVKMTTSLEKAATSVAETSEEDFF